MFSCITDSKNEFIYIPSKCGMYKYKSKKMTLFEYDDTTEFPAELWVGKVMLHQLS